MAQRKSSAGGSGKKAESDIEKQKRAKERERAAKKRAKERAKQERDVERYRKAAEAARKRAAEERSKQAARENDPERNCRDDIDMPDPACEYVLPQADFAFITGVTLENKTAPRLLELAKDA